MTNTVETSRLSVGNLNGALAANSAPTFTVGGTLITDFGNQDSGFDVTVQADDKILMVGSSSTNNMSDFALATLGDDYLIYETDTGKLLYDADGSGAGIATQIATLGINLTLTAADFMVV